MRLSQWRVLPGPPASCSFSDVAIGEVSPPLGAGWPDPWLWNPEPLQGHLQHRGTPLWFGAPKVAFAADWRSRLSEEAPENSVWSSWVVLKPVSKTAQWARSSGFHVSSAQLTLEDFSCSVFFVEGRNILISTMQHLLLKNICSC